MDLANHLLKANIEQALNNPRIKPFAHKQKYKWGRWPTSLVTLFGGSVPFKVPPDVPLPDAAATNGVFALLIYSHLNPSVDYIWFIFT